MTPFTIEKIATFAPMPSVSVRSTTTVKPRLRNSDRIAERMSWPNPSIKRMSPPPDTTDLHIDDILNRRRRINLPHLANVVGPNPLHLHVDQLSNRCRGIHLAHLLSVVWPDHLYAHLDHVS